MEDKLRNNYTVTTKGKVTTVTNINQLSIGQVKEIEFSIGEFLARVMLDKTRSTTPFDNRFVSHNLN